MTIQYKTGKKYAEGHPDRDAPPLFFRADNAAKPSRIPPQRLSQRTPELFTQVLGREDLCLRAEGKEKIEDLLVRTVKGIDILGGKRFYSFGAGVDSRMIDLLSFFC